MSSLAGPSRSERSYTWLSILALCLVTAFAVLIALAGRNSDPPGSPTPADTIASRSIVAELPEDTPEAPPSNPPTETTTLTPTDEETPAPTATPTASHTPAPTSTPTRTSTVTPTSTPVPPTATPTRIALITRPTRPAYEVPPGEHAWLQRPIGDEGLQVGSTYYPYGTTGQGEYLLHHGIDMVNPMDTSVLAAADGVIIFAGRDNQQVIGPMLDFYGGVIIQRIDQELVGIPVFCLYGHLNHIDVVQGQRVKAGQVIGRVGMSGIALGPHLHFEVRLGINDYGQTVNPDLWLTPYPDLGNIAGLVADRDGRTLQGHYIALYRADSLHQVSRQVYSYILQEGVWPDPAWKENFVVADLAAGSYVLETVIDGQTVSKTVHVVADQTVFVQLRPAP